MDREKHETEDRYAAFTEAMTVAVGALTNEQREELVTVIRRAIDRNCRVGNTVKAGAPITLTITPN